MNLNATRVEEILIDSLAEDLSEDERVVIEGIVNPYALNPTKLEGHKSEIIAMLADLPEQFRANGGGGWSFLNACLTKDGEQWTGLQQRMDQLFVLGMGIGRVTCPLPREMWSALPGGMPYYIIEV